jgi:hypothetical protein
VIDFRNHNLIGISGGNGSGKTSLIDIIQVALYGKSFRRDVARKLMNATSNKMFCSLTFLSNGEGYIIETTCEKKFSDVEITEDMKIVNNKIYKSCNISDLSSNDSYMHDPEDRKKAYKLIKGKAGIYYKIKCTQNVYNCAFDAENNVLRESMQKLENFETTSTFELFTAISIGFSMQDRCSEFGMYNMDGNYQLSILDELMKYDSLFLCKGLFKSSEGNVTSQKMKELYGSIKFSKSLNEYFLPKIISMVNSSLSDFEVSYKVMDGKINFFRLLSTYRESSGKKKLVTCNSQMSSSEVLIFNAVISSCFNELKNNGKSGIYVADGMFDYHDESALKKSKKIFEVLQQRYCNVIVMSVHEEKIDMCDHIVSIKKSKTDGSHLCA